MRDTSAQINWGPAQYNPFLPPACLNFVMKQYQEQNHRHRGAYLPQWTPRYIFYGKYNKSYFLETISLNKPLINGGTSSLPLTGTTRNNSVSLSNGWYNGCKVNQQLTLHSNNRGKSLEWNQIEGWKKNVQLNVQGLYDCYQKMSWVLKWY